jgi:alpha-amylase
MFGEAFDGRDDLLGSFTRPGELDSVFYFSQRGEVFASVFENAHDPNTQGGTQNIESIWRRRLTNWSNVPQAGGTGVAPSSMPVNFLDNHDVARFLYASKGDVAALRNALTLLLTEEGLPCLYYGTEQDFSGGNDPANREVMWTRGFDTTGTTFTHFARLAKIRRESVALRRGATEVVYSTSHTHDEPDAGLFAFERKNGDAGDRYALVMMNTNARNATQTEIRTTRPEGSVLVEMLGDTRRRLVVGPNGALNANLPAQSALILIPEDQLWPES